MTRVVLLILGMICFAGIVHAQETFPRNDVQDERANAFAFTKATIVVDPFTTITDGTLLIRRGKIEQVGSGLSIPEGYTVVDLQGKYIYPGFIDLYTSYGLPEVVRANGAGSAEQIQSNTKGPYNANESIKAEYAAALNFDIDKGEADSMRKAGFGSVLSFRADGIARGSSAFVTLAASSANKVVLNERASAHYAFNRGTSGQNFPRSYMGYIALLRQTYLDASWYEQQNPKPFNDISLESFNELQTLPQIFESTGWLTALRADKVGDEFGVQYIIKGGGDEYQRIDEVKNMDASMIVPINYPQAYDVEDPFDAERVSLRDMKHWEMAPGNLAALEKAGVSFAVTSSGLQKKGDFLVNIRKAIIHGLSKQTALAAITTVPAELVNMDAQVGRLKEGMEANFLITSDEIFKVETVIHENWVQGSKYVLNDMMQTDYAGQYELQIGDSSYSFIISGSPGDQKSEIKVNDTTTISVDMKLDGELITLGFAPQGQESRVRLSGWSNGVGKGFSGKGQLPDGLWVKWTATYQSSLPNTKKEETIEQPMVGELVYPFVAHGTRQLPKQETILIKNATVWTNETDGILLNTDVLLKDGKISKIGKDLSSKGAKIIDAKGKHVTSGIIDEHSHIGTSAINDVAANSSSVRIGDVLNSEDVNLYRALAGGVTAIQILHGSANPIGGQSALIKLRWGESPENLKIKVADGFIKFALGENVKKSWSNNSIRYPRTRMGVEQVFVDAFTNGMQYKERWSAYDSKPSKTRTAAEKPRRDLTNETMVEILDGKRFISCHSYVQSEINMLMKVAEDFNFRINTFTHILEGYKVADKMVAHGAGASTFSDWWGYKWEVRYAIPYNAAIMHREGVVTAINSDDPEMIRRLNQEAAKTIKYGGLSEEEAWKMVTLNPAKLLHLDDEMGSIKVGKSADVVVWSDHPLSIYAKSEKTIIDGKVYFDLEKDARINQEIVAERARLIQKIKLAKKNGAKTQNGGSAEAVEFHCEDDFGSMNNQLIDY